MLNPSENKASELALEENESEIRDKESSPQQYEIQVYPADFTLEVLYSKWKNGELIIPKFQRRFVWNKNQSSRLIESFLMGLPVPSIFLYTTQDQRNIIVDGHQRLMSIYYFMEGYFGESDLQGKRQIFTISGINESSKWYGKTFMEFEDSDRRKLNNSVLRTIIIRQLNPKDNTSIYHIFERLNTGGTALRDQEVRNCVYEGKLNDLLLELNRSNEWRELLGRPSIDIRQRDVELILRYMALYHKVEEYTKPMKDFLSSYMGENRNPPDEFIKQERDRFLETCRLIKNKLGNRPFNPKGPLNASIFDCIFLAFAKHLDTCPADINERFKKLLEYDEFKKVTSAATTDPPTVKSRMELAEEMLFD